MNFFCQINSTSQKKKERKASQAIQQLKCVAKLVTLHNWKKKKHWWRCSTLKVLNDFLCDNLPYPLRVSAS
jgi:hypothetical protein